MPNGDVLMIQSRGPEGEPTSRPKDSIRGWIMSIAHGGGGGEQKESNLITLLRDTNRDGTVDEKHDLLKKLDSPFGVAWIVDTLYVASTAAILAYPYKLGQNEITAQPRVLTPLPGPDRPPLDKGSGAQPGWADALRIGRLEFQHRRERA